MKEWYHVSELEQRAPDEQISDRAAAVGAIVSIGAIAICLWGMFKISQSAGRTSGDESVVTEFRKWATR